MLTTWYPLFERIMSTRFFPMSCTSPFTVASNMRPRPPSLVFSICGSRYATADFITSALCNTKGSCISPLPKSSPTTFIPSRRWSLMMASGANPSVMAASKSSVSPTFSPSMMRRSRRWRSGSAASSEALILRDAANSTPSKSCRNSCSGSYVQFSPSKTLRS